MAKVMLGELLVGAGLVTEEQVLTALRGQRGTGLPLGHYLVRSGVLAEDELVRALSQQLSVPIVFLDALRLPDDALRKVSADFARANLVIPFKLEGRTLLVATADPTRDELLGELRISTHCDVRFSMATPSSIDRALERGYTRLPGAAPAPATSPALPSKTGSFAVPNLAAFASGAPAAGPGVPATASLSSAGQDLAAAGGPALTLEKRVAELETQVAKLVAVTVKHELAKKEDFASSPGARPPAAPRG